MSPPLLDTQDCAPAVGACGGSNNGTGQASVSGARVFPGNLLEAEAPEPSCPGGHGGLPQSWGLGPMLPTGWWKIQPHFLHQVAMGRWCRAG